MTGRLWIQLSIFCPSKNSQNAALLCFFESDSKTRYPQLNQWALTSSSTLPLGLQNSRAAP
jgi:hypothetical protein